MTIFIVDQFYAIRFTIDLFKFSNISNVIGTAYRSDLFTDSERAQKIHNFALASLNLFSSLTIFDIPHVENQNRITLYNKYLTIFFVHNIPKIKEYFYQKSIS